MTKTILITGSTDGIGLATAKILAAQGHNVLLHGRSQTKLDAAASELRSISAGGAIAQYQADLSDLAAVQALASDVAANHEDLDALINNAGVFKVADPRAANGLDMRFMVNV